MHWQGIGTKLPDGHTIHESVERPGRWAIADNSGPYPDLTDDGVLWLNNDSRMGEFRCLQADPPTIPIMDDNGEEFRVITDTATILFLSQMLRWTVEDESRGHFYNVR